MIVVRLPGTVKEVFEERVRAALPLRADRILARTREVRAGKLNDPRFGTRQTGEGQYADTIAQLFDRTARRLGLTARRRRRRPTCRRRFDGRGRKSSSSYSGRADLRVRDEQAETATGRFGHGYWTILTLTT